MIFKAATMAFLESTILEAASQNNTFQVPKSINVKIGELYFSVDFKEDHSKSALVNDGQNHADQDFYDNLPFNKLRNPPKHVILILKLYMAM